MTRKSSKCLAGLWLLVLWVVSAYANVQIPVSSQASGDTAHCSVLAAELTLAQQRFNEQCGGTPVDCDWMDGHWRCANVVIGRLAPAGRLTGSASAISTPGSPLPRCTVRGSDLHSAKSAYAALCDLPRVDCDPIAGQWYCSSGQLGDYAPVPTPVARVEPEDTDSLEGQVRAAIRAASGDRGLAAFRLPHSADLASIPQDPLNPLTPAKVALGQLLFHDTAFALNGRLNDNETWSCATCHHAAAGFKAGVRQGIGNGGIGFGAFGQQRVLATGFDGNAEADSERMPDVQPIASPSILNSAWQDVMLWNGQFGNSLNGIVNNHVARERLLAAGTPKAFNATGLSGVEVQAMAGTGVHRLRFSDHSPLQVNDVYRGLWQAAFDDEALPELMGAGMAIAAYERTVIANQAPFQRWLRGEPGTMNESQLRGAQLFFGSAGCVDCHRGPALSSEAGAMAEQMFMALGFSDLDANNPTLAGQVDEATRLGRGGLTGLAHDNYRFKIPQLYNLADAPVLGHGGTFTSVREVIEYKNQAVAQHPDVPLSALDTRFRPLGLSESQVSDLTAFVRDALRDPALARYQPEMVPSGKCVVVDAGEWAADATCSGN